MNLQKNPNKKAIVLLSGGLDSTVTLYYAKAEGYDVYALTIKYGQSHSIEIEKARGTAKMLGVEHYVLDISLPWKGSSLLDTAMPIPSRKSEDISTEIPSTYVPGRNTIFLSFALSWAETIYADSIFIGANQLDYSGYPDCREEFFESLQSTFKVGTKCGIEGHGVRIETPLLRMNKKEIVLLGKKLNVPFENTWSCYRGEKKPCGTCDSCVLRAKGFQEAGCPDPSN